MRRVITFLSVGSVSFYSAYIYWINNPQSWEYVSLDLYRPYVYRQLMAMLARVLVWFDVAPNWAVVLAMTGAGIGLFYAFKALVNHFYPTNELYIFGLFSVGLLLFWSKRSPYDWATACLFSLALLFLMRDKLLVYCLLFPIVCLNRETGFLLVIFYLFYDHDIHMGRDIAIMLYQVIVWLSVRLSLMYIFRANGGVDAWVMPLRNFQVFLAHPWHSLLHISIFGVILCLVIKDWYSKPYNLRLAFCIFAPILLIMYWIFGQAFEVRVLWEAYPVTALLMLPSVKPYKVVCDGGMPNE